MYSEFMGTLKGRMYLEPLGSKCSRVQLHEDKCGGGGVECDKGNMGVT